MGQSIDRRGFLHSSLATPLSATGAGMAPQQPADFNEHGGLIIERTEAGTPHAGKVLAAIQPHSDDLTIFAAGLVFKLLAEGYTGYLIRTTNDDSAGPGSVGNTVFENEKDNIEVGRRFGFRRIFNLNYPNHNMDGTSKPELRARLIFLFRLLKVNTVVSYDPWGHYEENPDHYVTASCVEAACWMAGGDKDYPEHFAAGIQPHPVTEKYYFARFQQRVNRVVDIGPYVEKKIDALLANVAQGPAGNAGAKLRARLAEKKLRLPLLGESDDTANRNYIREFVLSDNRQLGQQYGLEYAEQYHHIRTPPDPVEAYVKAHAVPL